MKSLGARRRSRLRICAELSTSRCRAAAISIGWTALRKARAKAPVTSCLEPLLETVQGTHVVLSSLSFV